jgi:hypothetical protein
VVTVRVIPVASFVNSTVTPGTIAPEVSRIVPTKSAVVTWLYAGEDNRSSKQSVTSESRFRVRVMPSS